MTTTREGFLKNVARHELSIVLDQGRHRHLIVRRPDTFCMGFEIVTWPGYLAITGDMGSYTFWRLPDMFEFFRRDADRDLEINAGYWAEKLTAIDRTGYEEFDADKLRAAVLEHLDSGWDIPPAEMADLRQRVQKELFRYFHDGEIRARDAIYRFIHPTVTFQDFSEVNCRRYTPRFIWCCWAIVWSIREYDRAKAAARVPS